MATETLLLKDFGVARHAGAWETGGQRFQEVPGIRFHVSNLQDSSSRNVAKVQSLTSKVCFHNFKCNLQKV